MWQQFVKDYLTFSKKDRIALLTLIAVITIVAIAPVFFPKQEPYELSGEDFAFVEMLRDKTPEAAESEDEQNFQATFLIEEERNSAPEINYFYFDPNTISTAQWQQLGVPQRTANTIQKYISKGGVFKKPEDLSKIYTLDKKIAAKLIPYVRIEESGKIEPPTPFPTEQPFEEKELKTPFPRKEYHIVDINTADTTTLKTLPGIGSFRAKMIVNLRDSLLGFQSADQLKGRWFFPDSVFQKLRPYLETGTYHYPLLNINTVTLEELEKHPLFGKTLSKVIIAYRDQHGAFMEVSDLLKIHLIDDELYEKIKPFVVVKSNSLPITF